MDILSALYFIIVSLFGIVLGIMIIIVLAGIIAHGW